MLYTKSIYKNPEPEDGLRVSAMSRHTLKDGKTPDPDIQKCDFHIPTFGPSPKLIVDFYKDRISWDEYKRLYLEEIRSNPNVVSQMKFFAKYAIEHDVTLLCVEEKADDCHRKLLAEEFQRLVPELTVVHR